MPLDAGGRPSVVAGEAFMGLGSEWCSSSCEVPLSAPLYIFSFP